MGLAPAIFVNAHVIRCVLALKHSQGIPDGLLKGALYVMHQYVEQLLCDVPIVVVQGCEDGKVPVLTHDAD